ncbi:MAG: hypothetical protein U0S50_03155 [Sphingopyxis sp.]|uniref:hypothetical protein n=1 Tax=Sphingopyxis sp. TaxID=1908224 RepID=UPI002ABA0964|nr:hypothetical protein [Sphingopyxis sp.]MDZ3830801.1 hypothetical protein [Sphingopyxis sp.]
MTGPQALWRWTAIFAVLTAIIMAGFGQIDGMKACGGGDPIFAFEMVRSPADVAALFPEPCRASHAAAQRTGLWVDIALFIWVYSAFLIFGLLALRREAGQGANRIVRLAMLCAAIAAAADQFENLQLLRLLDTLPGDQSTIDALFAAPRVKFALLGVVTMVAGLLHFRQPGWRKIVGAAALAGGLLAAIGVVAAHHWVLPGLFLGWSPLLVAALILSFRRAPGAPLPA